MSSYWQSSLCILMWNQNNKRFWSRLSRLADLPPTGDNHGVARGLCVSLGAQPDSHCSGQCAPWLSRHKRCYCWAWRGNSADPGARDDGMSSCLKQNLLLNKLKSQNSSLLKKPEQWPILAKTKQMRQCWRKPASRDKHQIRRLNQHNDSIL